VQVVSDRFLEEVRGSHTPAYSVTIDGAELPVRAGSVTLNAQGATRASLSLTLAVAEWELEDYVPDDLGDLLAPAGGEIIVKRGIAYSDGTTELVPLGVFRIDETDGDDSGDDLPLQISALDRSARIIEAVFEKAGYTAAGETVEDEILTPTANCAPPSVSRVAVHDTVGLVVSLTVPVGASTVRVGFST